MLPSSFEFIFDNMTIFDASLSARYEERKNDLNFEYNTHQEGEMCSFFLVALYHNLLSRPEEEEVIITQLYINREGRTVPVGYSPAKKTDTQLHFPLALLSVLLFQVSALHIQKTIKSIYERNYCGGQYVAIFVKM